MTKQHHAPPTVPFMRLRVWYEYDDAYKSHVGYCLETGAVVSGDDEQTVKTEMLELLEDQLISLMKTKNIANFYSSPAPYEILEKWNKASETRQPEIMEISIDPERVGDKGVKSEVELARAA